MDADDVLRSATLRLVKTSGAFAGTGFAVLGDGTFLTCRHVALGDATLFAVANDGRRWQVEWLSCDDKALARADIAVMRLRGAVVELPDPVPLLAAAPTGRFRTRAHLKEAAEYLEAAPLEGLLQGDMTIAYRSRDESYTTTGSLLTGLSVLPGMSGSALWDVGRQAVVGLIAVGTGPNSNIGGFALPLAHVGDSPRLMDILRRNDDEVPRFGCEPNRTGARRLLHRASNRTLERLSDRGIIVPEAFIKREGFAEALDGFLCSPAPAFPIVSAAGQGKTSLLAALAQSPSSRPVWLARALDLSAVEPPGRALDRLLGDSVALPEGCTWATLARRVAPKPLLLLDGLNELSLTERQIVEEWLPDLIGEAGRAGWKLAFTTRRELFAKIERSPAAAKLYRPPGGSEDGKTGWFVLGQFTSGEAAAAMHKYGLPARLAHAVGRQPLIIRLAAGGRSIRTRRDALNAHVDSLIEAVAEALSDRHPATFKKTLGQIAVAIGDNEDGLLRYDEPVAQDAPLMEAFRKANLLERVDAGYRVVFDEVAEFLIGASLAHSSADLSLANAKPNVLALAIEERAAADPAAAVEAVERLLEQMPGRSISGQIDIFRILLALGGLSKFEAAKIRSVQHMVDGGSWKTLIYVEADLPSRLPEDAFVLLTKTAILAKHGYGWREKDVWSEWHRPMTISIARAEIGLGRLIRDMMSDTSIDGPGLLIDWLSDSRRLSHDGRPFASIEATVSSYALCMLLAYRERAGIERIFHEVVLAGRSGGDALLEALCKEEPSTVVALLGKLPVKAATRHLPTIVRAWHLLILGNAELAEEIRGAAAEALTPLFQMADVAGLKILIHLSIHAEVAPAVDLKKVFAGIPPHELDADSLIVALTGNLIDVEAAFELAARGGFDERLVWSLAVKWRSEDPVVALGYLVDRMRVSHFSRQDLRSEAAWGLESILRQVGLDQAKNCGLCDFAAELLDASEELPSSLLFPAFSRHPAKEEANDALRVWLAKLLSASPKLGAERASAIRIASSSGGFGSHRDIVLSLARECSLRDLISIHFAREGLPRSDEAMVFRAGVAGAIERADPEAEQMSAVLAILEDKSRSDADVSLVVEHLLLERLGA